MDGEAKDGGQQLIEYKRKRWPSAKEINIIC